jgi:hypothetical protein
MILPFIWLFYELKVRDVPEFVTTNHLRGAMAMKVKNSRYVNRDLRLS